MTTPPGRLLARLGPPTAAALTILIVASSACAMALIPLNGGNVGESDTSGSVLLALSFGFAGGFIVFRRPGNPIGWIMLVCGFFNGLNAFTSEYPRYALIVEEGSVPGGGLAAWAGSWAWALGAVAFPLILWLFPTGRPPGPGWHWLRWPLLIGTGLIVVPLAVSTWELRVVAVLSGSRPEEMVTGFPSLLWVLGTAVLALSLVAAIVSSVIRYRRAGWEERQQLKWLLAAGVLTLIVLLTVSPAAPFEPPPLVRAILDYVGPLTLPSIPAAITLAILRYRLYDIDRIVSRTVAYALVATLLAAVYGLGVIALQALLPTSGDLAVAASTLLAAALFAPLLRRVQELVDRRFNRRRYDARLVVEDLSARLYGAVDLAALTDDLRSVVAQTMEPQSATVWLRPGR